METWRDRFWGLWDIFRRKTHPRSNRPGEGKHIKGHCKPDNWRVVLKAKRKAERQHRRRVRLQAAGKKHRFTS